MSDGVPPQIETLVELEPDGGLAFWRVVETSERAHVEIVAIEPWFGMRHLGRRDRLIGEIRAVLPEGDRVLVARELRSVSAGVVLGAANAIRDAHLAARAGTPVARGDASEVPSGILDLTAKGRAVE